MIHDLVAKDIHILTGEEYGSSSVVIEMGSDAMMIDGLANRKDASDLREWIDERALTVRTIVATHYFSDHMAAFRDLPDAEIIAHRNYRHTWDSEAWRTQEESRHFVEPTILVHDGLTLRWGRYDIEIFYNPGHTMSTLTVDIPAADLIHASDNLVGSIVYLYYSSPTAIRDALERVRSRRRGRVLASHGGVRPIETVDHAIHYLDELERRARAARHQDRREEILAIELDDCLPVGVPGTSFERIFHRRNLETILEKRLFKPFHSFRPARERETSLFRNCG